MITVSNVMNASRGELLCITYEILLESIQQAKEHFDDKAQKKHLQKALQALKMLTEDLNFDYAISKDLFRIYVYVQGLLVTAKQKEQLDEAYRLIDRIYGGFKQITDAEATNVKTPKKAPYSESIYAGMTYGKGQLNETIVHQNKGFKA